MSKRSATEAGLAVNGHKSYKVSNGSVSVPAATGLRQILQRLPQQQQPQPAPMHPDWMSMLIYFDAPRLRSVLEHAALYNYPVQNLILDNYAQVYALLERQRQAEKAKVIDFSHYSGDAWHALNTKYASGKGSKDYMLAGEAFSDVQDCINSIAKQATPDTSYGTKKSALETLRRIGKSICLGDGAIGHEVRKDFQRNPSLRDAMMGILESMDAAEVETLANSTDHKGTFLAKVTQLVAEANSYCIMEGIDDVLQEMLSTSEPEEDIEDGSDEDQDGSDEEEEEEEEEEEIDDDEDAKDDDN